MLTISLTFHQSSSSKCIFPITTVGRLRFVLFTEERLGKSKVSVSKRHKPCSSSLAAENRSSSDEIVRFRSLEANCVFDPFACQFLPKINPYTFIRHICHRRRKNLASCALKGRHLNKAVMFCQVVLTRRSSVNLFNACCAGRTFKFSRYVPQGAIHLSDSISKITV